MIASQPKRHEIINHQPATTDIPSNKYTVMPRITKTRTEWNALFVRRKSFRACQQHYWPKHMNDCHFNWNQFLADCSTSTRFSVYEILTQCSGGREKSFFSLNPMANQVSKSIEKENKLADSRTRRTVSEIVCDVHRIRLTSDFIMAPFNQR